MSAASGCGLGLWAGFVPADEVFLAYPVEATHWRLFVAQLAVELLPEDAPVELRRPPEE